LEFSFPGLFKARFTPLVGLDISSSSVKLVELAQTGPGQYRLERYIIERLPKDAVVDGNITNLEAVGEIIRAAWRNLGSRTRNVALALPAAAVITRKIVLPANLKEAELEVQAEAEANQSIPFPLDEVNLDFQVLGPSAKTPEENEVLIAASRKEKVEDRVAAAEAAGLKALVMDVESFAAQNAYEIMANQLPEQGREQTVAIIDIGAAATHINILRNNQSVYLRDQSFGGNQLTQEIQRHYGMTFEEAESMKRMGSLPESYESEVLTPFLDTLAQEIVRAQQFFFSSTPYQKLDHIFLAGGCASIPGLDEMVSSRTRTSTMIANPFASMSISSKVKARELTMDAPALLIACGLALRSFDPL
jgi:type IV pilus assembly protein PilM